jgi:hypothetical protein
VGGHVIDEEEIPATVDAINSEGAVVQLETSAARELNHPAEDCHDQLDRILNGADFEATDREQRFLGHVEETLSGGVTGIEAYSIAVKVFGHDISFDPQLLRVKICCRLC